MEAGQWGWPVWELLRSHATGFWGAVGVAKRVEVRGATMGRQKWGSEGGA